MGNEMGNATGRVDWPLCRVTHGALWNLPEMCELIDLDVLIANGSYLGEPTNRRISPVWVSLWKCPML